MHRTIRKYSPKKLSEFTGRQPQLNELREAVAQNVKAILLHGPTGCGKTTAVYALAKEMEYEVLEINASDARDKESMLSMIGTASKQMSLFNRGKIILIDDVDALSSKDRGAASAISTIVEESEWPVVMTASDVNEEKIKDIRKKCSVIGMERLPYTDVCDILKCVCIGENISYDDTALKSLSRQCDGDVRAAMTDLNVLATGCGSVSDLSSLAPRQYSDQIQSALLLIFKGMRAESVLHAFDSVDMDFSDRMLWIDENLPKEYSWKDLSKAYEVMSRADMFQGRIMRRQHWRFLAYMDELLTAGIALAKSEKNSLPVEYKRSSRPLKYWLANMKYAKRKAIAEKVAPYLHVSKKKAFRDITPFLPMIFKCNEGALASLFNLTEEEAEWLKR